MKKLSFLIVLILGAIGTRAANIVWVSDAPNNGGPFFTNSFDTFADHGWVHVLTNAGHNVVRYNPPDSSATTLPQAHIDALNTNDLIILGRTLGSGAFQNPPQVVDWNTRITKPLMTVNAYLARFIRLGWFLAPGSTQPDGVPTRLTAADINDSVTDYIFSEVALTNGNTTAEVYDEAIDRNTSHVLEVPVTGGRIIARTAATIGGTNPVAIAEWPAGVAVRNGADILAGYRMYFAAASRELNGASIPGTAGKENLTSDGENMFLRAVEIAVRGGTSPISPTSPVGVRRQPVSLTVDEGLAATFSAGITGAPPRSLQWERNDGAGFSDIPDATASRYTLSRARATDNGAVFRLRASNPFGNVTTDPAILTVNPDVTAPIVLAVRPTESFSQITVRFSEAVDGGATDPANYQLDGGVTVSSVLLLDNGTNVVLTTATPMAEATTYNLTIAGIRDTAVASNTVATVSISFTTLCTQPGFVRREIYSGITGSALSGLLTHPNFINRNPSAISLLPTPEADTSGDNYGTRLSGYLVPAISGEYIFYLASDDNSQLFLSPNTEPSDAILIGQETSFNARRLWIGDRTGGTRGLTNANISTNYAVINLTAGQRYFFQVFHKEGTGGDHLGFTWQAPGDTLPVNGTASAITNIHVIAISPCATVTFVQQPESQSVLENRSVTFAVALSNSVPNLVAAYQWRKDGVAIAGETNASYTIPLAQITDEGAYDVVVIVPGGGATSAAATLDVTEDTEPPRIVSVGSIDGRTIGVCFDELLNTNELSTTIDPFAYEINDHSDHVVTNVVLRPDGRSVLLIIDSALGNLPLTGQFLITATSITDREGNGEANVTSASSTVFGAIGANLGTPLASGSHYSCEANTMELVGGGLDIWSTADQGYWAYKPITGDFDARVRLDSLSLPWPSGPALTAKGGIIVRDTAEANSPTLHLLANPLPPGRNLAEAGRRQTVNGSTTSWGTNQTTLNIPHWLRLVRAGNTFTGYRSSNGVDWIVFANTTQAAAPATMLLGLGVTSHTNSGTLYTTGKFSNFSISQPVADVAIHSATGPSLVAVGGSLSYNLTVTNLGPDTASAVVLQDTLPSGVTFVSATASQGACSHAAGVVTCNLGTLAANGSATITINGTATTAGALNNTAVVSSGAVDLDLGNNSASVSTKAVTRARVGSITYSTSGGFNGSFLTENGCTYTIEFKDDLSDNIPWAPLPGGGPIAGDGTAKPISDPEVRTKRFYRVRIEAP